MAYDTKKGRTDKKDLDKVEKDREKARVKQEKERNKNNPSGNPHAER